MRSWLRLISALTPRESAGGLLAFLALSYAITWASFITVARWLPADTTAGYALVLFGAYTPGIVGLLLTAISEGGSGVTALLRRILIADVRLYMLALTYITVVKVAAAILHRFITGAWPPFGGGSLALIPLAIALAERFPDQL